MKNMILFSCLILSTIAFGASPQGDSRVFALINKFNALSKQAESDAASSSCTCEKTKAETNRLEQVQCENSSHSSSERYSVPRITMKQVSISDQLRGTFAGKSIAEVVLRTVEGKNIKLIESRGWYFANGILTITARPNAKIEEVFITVNEYCYPGRISFADHAK